MQTWPVQTDSIGALSIGALVLLRAIAHTPPLAAVPQKLLWPMSFENVALEFERCGSGKICAVRYLRGTLFHARRCVPSGALDRGVAVLELFGERGANRVAQ